MSPPLARLMRSSVVHVGFAFLAMGSWAVFANRAHPLPAPLLAGLIQGLLSAGITLILKRGIEALARRFSGLAALLAPPLIAGLVSASLLTAIHTLGGTPEIARTIAVPLTVATSYAALYNLSLWRSRKAMNHGAG
jgi:mannose/fructose/N-acetylgalactosamine-specific phosphotransferase system component IIC